MDLSAATLTIRTGKSRREKAEQRTIPMSKHLRDFLVPYVAGRAGDEPVMMRRIDQSEGGIGPVGTLTKAWEKAIKAGDVRREVYAPANRKNARPDHAFRAAFQHSLVMAGVRDEVIDALVGHASTRRDSRRCGRRSMRCRWSRRRRTRKSRASTTTAPTSWRSRRGSQSAPSSVNWVPIRDPVGG